MKNFSIYFLLMIVFTVSKIFSQEKIISSIKLEKIIEPKLFSVETVFQNASKNLLAEDFEVKCAI